MSNPVDIEKELKDWDFDDLVKWACWQVVQGMYNGSTLKSTMWQVLTVAVQWKPKK